MRGSCGPKVAAEARRDYVLGKHGRWGYSDARILLRHILPNTISQPLIYAMSDIVVVIVGVVTLSYLGLGVPPPTADWGRDDRRGAAFHDHALDAFDAARDCRRRHRPCVFADRRRASALDAASMTALEIADMEVWLPGRRGLVHAVRGVSLSIGPRQIHGIVGESGCGKSTLLKTVLGLQPRGARTSGRIATAGRVGIVFQEPMSALNPVMRVGAQIAEAPQRVLGLSRARARARALELLRQVGVPDPERRLEAYPHETLRWVCGSGC